MALNPAALAVLAALGAAWSWLFAVRSTPLVVNGRTLSERETLLAASATSVVVVFFLTSAGAVLFSALGLSAAAVAAHGALRAPDDLFTDEVEVRDRERERGRGGGGEDTRRVGLCLIRAPPHPPLFPSSLSQAPGGLLGMLTGGGGARPVAAAV